MASSSSISSGTWAGLARLLGSGSGISAERFREGVAACMKGQLQPILMVPQGAPVAVEDPCIGLATRLRPA